METSHMQKQWCISHKSFANPSHDWNMHFGVYILRLFNLLMKVSVFTVMHTVKWRQNHGAQPRDIQYSGTETIKCIH